MYPLDESKVTPYGAEPPTTGILVITLSVAPLITETLVDPKFVTYRSPLDESKVIPAGSEPTGMLVITLSVAPLITETLFDPEFVT